MKTPDSSKTSGFTLTEILVVIGIIALLAALIFPAFGRVRQKANEATCLANMRQSGAAILVYVADSDGQFPASRGGNFNWDDELLEREIISDFSLTRQGCPESRSTLSATYGYNYMQLGNAAEHRIGRRRPIQVEKPSETIMLADGHNRPGVTWPNLVYWDNSFWLGDNAPIGHRGGVNIVWVDGHASWMSIEDVYPDPSKKLPDTTIGYNLRVPYYFARTKTVQN